jgi:HlyD family secretion protein
MAKLKPWAWPLALAALLIAALGYALWPRPVSVDLAIVEEGAMAVTIEDDGITRVKEVYVISAPIAGRMLRIETHAGDSIEAQKTVIAMIEPADPAFRDVRAQRELEFTVSAIRAARDLAAAAVKGRDAELELARQELGRTRQLFAKGIVAKARIDHDEAQVKALAAELATAQAALRQRDFEVKTAEAALILPSDATRMKDNGRCCFTIRAPIDGQMLRLLHENEAVVQMGEPLAEVGDPNDLEIIVDLLSSEAVKVAEGDTVSITRWGGEGVLNGRVRRIEPFGVTKISSLGIEEQRVNVIVDLTDPHERWQRLGHGYQVDVAIVRWHADKALQVPIGTLFRQGADWAVFRVDSGRAKQTVVNIGHMNDEAAEVLGGLNAGDRVISHPGERVADGVRVVAR